MKYYKKKIILNLVKSKAVYTFCVTVICGLHFDKKSRINYEKYDGNYQDQWYLSNY